MMQRAITLAAAIVTLGASTTPHAALAAPDNTLGMALLSARINPDGSVAFGSGIQESDKIGTGHYQIIFDRDVAFVCVFTATRHGGSGYANTVPFGAHPRRVEVHVYDTAGAHEDDVAHLLVFCHR